jgi:hypothetical protein
VAIEIEGDKVCLHDQAVAIGLQVFGENVPLQRPVNLTAGEYFGGKYRR